MFYLLSADSSARVSITEQLGTDPTTYRLYYTRAKLSIHFVLLNFKVGKSLSKRIYTAQKNNHYPSTASIAGMPARVRTSTHT